MLKWGLGLVKESRKHNNLHLAVLWAVLVLLILLLETAGH